MIGQSSTDALAGMLARVEELKALSADPERQAWLAEQQKRDELRRHNARLDALERRIPAQFRGADLATCRRDAHCAQALDAARHVVAEGFLVGLGLFGSNGVGKSYLGAGIARAALLAGIPARFEAASGFVERLADATLFSSEDQVTRAIREVAETPVLVLDDLGRERLDRRTMSWIFLLLDWRLNDARTIVVTTNYPPEKLLKRYLAAAERCGEDPSAATSIFDRLCGLAPLPWVEMRGKSLRGRRPEHS